MTADNTLYPFANISHLAKRPPLVIERGDGVYVYDSAGKKYIDGQGGFGTSMQGTTGRRSLPPSRRSLKS